MTCIIGSSDFSPLKKKKIREKVACGGFKGYLHEFSPLSVTFALLFPPVLKGQRPSKLNEIMSRATRALTYPFFFFFYLDSDSCWQMHVCNQFDLGSLSISAY